MLLSLHQEKQTNQTRKCTYKQANMEKSGKQFKLTSRFLNIYDGDIQIILKTESSSSQLIPKIFKMMQHEQLFFAD